MKGMAATCVLLIHSLCLVAWGNGEQNAEGGHAEAAQLSLQEPSCSADDFELEYVLYEAALAGQREIVLRLVENGAPLRAGIAGAACGGHWDIVKLMLEKGARPDSGLSGAVRGGHADIAEQMLELGGKSV